MNIISIVEIIVLILVFIWIYIAYKFKKEHAIKRARIILILLGL